VSVPRRSVFAVDLSERVDAVFEIDGLAGTIRPPQPSSLGAGYLILVARELTGLSQRRLAAKIGTSQASLARLETGNRIPTVVPSTSTASL
jgi:hypothetical protein